MSTTAAPPAATAAVQPVDGVVPHGRPPDIIDWRRVVLLGAALGCATASVVTLDMPASLLLSPSALRLVLGFLVQTLVFGIALSFASAVPGATRSLPRVALVLAGCVALSLSVDRGFWIVVADPDAVGLPRMSGWQHMAWVSTVVGVAFLVAQRLRLRAQRDRQRLAAASLARERTEALLAAQRLQALRGRIDPQLLLRTMAEIQACYRSDAVRVQRLLDALVAMLRAAMPGLRSSTSTLTSEASLLRDYAALRSELDPGRWRWRVEIDPSLGAEPFPALMTLPLADALLGGTAPGYAVDLDVRRTAAGATLALVGRGDASAAWLPADLLFRLQVGLRALHGDGWRMHVGETRGERRLALDIGVAAPTAA